jgi:predicted transcriptional regulator
MPDFTKKLATLTVRVSPEIVEKIDEVARFDEISRADVIRKSIKIGISKLRQARRLNVKFT